MQKRIISLALVVAMVLTILPTMAIANAVAALVSGNYTVDKIDTSNAGTAENLTWEEWAAQVEAESPIEQEVSELDRIFSENEYFSDLDSDDEAYIITELDISDDTMSMLETEGLGLIESIAYAQVESKNGYEAEFLLEQFPEHEAINNFSLSIERYDSSLSDEYVGSELDIHFREYLLEGFSFGQISSAYNISNILDIEMDVLLGIEKSDEDTTDDKAGFEEEDETGAENEDETLTEAQLSSISTEDIDTEITFAKESLVLNELDVYGINTDAIKEYAVENDMSSEDLEALLGESAMYDGTVFLASEDDEVDDPYNKAPNYIELNSEEQYIPNNSSITYQHTDYVLEGKNGLDLTIGRVYNSSINLYNGFSTVRHFQQIHGLGAGWQFMFASIEVNSAWDVILHTGTGASYSVSWEQSNGFKEYELDDMKLSQNPGTQTAKYTSSLNSVRSSYVLEYKDGKVEYFDNNGKLICIMDKYGNKIEFQYNYTGLGDSDINYEIKIVDSLSREIYIRKTVGDTTSQIVVDLPDDEKLRYTTEKLENATSVLDNTQTTGHTYVLKSFEDQDQVLDSSKGKTEYEYQRLELKYDPLSSNKSLTLARGTAIAYPLRAIYYPSDSYVERDGSGHEKIYYYYGLTEICLSKGFTQKPYLSARTIHANNHGVSGNNVQVQTEVPNFTQYYSDKANPTNGKITENYTSEVKYYVGDIEIFGEIDYYTVNYTFNSDHRIIREERTDSFGNCMSISEYEYNSDKLPIRIITRDFNAGAGKYSATIQAYEYDGCGNTIGEWPAMPYAETDPTSVSWKDCTLDDNYKVSYTYDTAYTVNRSHYNMPLSVSYKIDDTQTVQEEFTLTNDKKGIETQAVNVNGAPKSKTSYIYDSAGNVVSEKRYYNATDGYLTEYTYQNEAYLIEQRVNGVLDTDGNNAVSSPGETSGTIVTKFSYDTCGKLLTSTDENGNLTSYTYTPTGAVDTITHPDLSTTKYTRNYKDNSVIITDGNNNAVKYEYNFLGNLTKTTDLSAYQNTVLSQMYYDCAGNLLYMYNDFEQTAYQYDIKGRLVNTLVENFSSKIPPEEVIYTYEEAYGIDKLTKVTTTSLSNYERIPDLVSVEYTDGFGNRVYAGNTINGVESLNSYEYDYRGNMTKEITAGAVTPYSAKYVYDYAGKVIKTYNADGDVAVSKYDMLGNLKQTADFEGRAVNYDYDALGRNIKIWGFVDADEGFYYGTGYFYYPDGSIKSESIKDDPSGSASWRTTEYGYYSNGLLEYVKQAYSVTEYGYDNVGNLLTATSGLSARSAGDGKTTSYTYDQFGNVKTVTDAEGKTDYYNYSSIGRLTSHIDSEGNNTTYVIDSLGREVSQTVSDTIAIISQYAPNGDLAAKSETSGSGTSLLIYSYDDAGRLSSAAYQSPSVDLELSEYTYYTDGQRATYTLTKGALVSLAVEYDYNSRGLLERVYSANAGATTYTYDRNGSLLTETVNGTNITVYTYNDMGLPDTEKHYKHAALQLSFDYSYYADGSTYQVIKSDGRILTYTYDDVGRLESEIEIDPSKKDNVQYEASYTYDRNGNRLTSLIVSKNSANANANAIQTDYIYDVNNRLTAETHTEISKNKSTLVKTVGYTYDSNGNMKTRTTETKSPNKKYTDTYTYDTLNRLTSLTESGVSITYDYRADGLRESKTESGKKTTHSWDMDDIVADVTPTGTSTEITTYLRGIGLIFADSSVTGDWYYQKNARGDVVQVLNTTGTATHTYYYTAFGEEREDSLSGSSTVPNPFRYCGEYYDSETKSIYLRARYYVPGTGRFTQADTHWNPGNMQFGDNPAELASGGYAPSASAIMQSSNLYAYAGNNPVKYRDITGNFFISALVISVIVGVVVGATAGGIIGNAVAESNGVAKEDKWKYILTGAIGGGILGGMLGYVAAPALTATGFTGISVTASGITAVTAAPTIAPALQRLFNDSAGHIFSNDHIKNGIMSLGSGQIDIFNKITSIANSYAGKWTAGSNEIRTVVNGIETTIRFYVQNDKIVNINAFLGYSERVIGTLLK